MTFKHKEQTYYETQLINTSQTENQCTDIRALKASADCMLYNLHTPTSTHKIDYNKQHTKKGMTVQSAIITTAHAIAAHNF
jgi:hypothetical protein